MIPFTSLPSLLLVHEVLHFGFFVLFTKNIHKALAIVGRRFMSCYPIRVSLVPNFLSTVTQFRVQYRNPNIGHPQKR